MSIQATGFQRADLNLEYEAIDETAEQQQSAETKPERVCCKCIVPDQSVCNTEGNSGTFMTAASGFIYVFVYA